MSDYRIQGETGEWEVVIGLEVHAQISSISKLFSGAATDRPEASFFTCFPFCGPLFQPILGKPSIRV